MTANVLRDAQVLPAIQAILGGSLLRYLDQARQVLTEPPRCPRTPSRTS